MDGLQDDDDARWAVLERYRRIMDEHGWAIVAVEPDAADPAGSFTYTVGLSKAGAPELVVTGMPAESGAALLGDLAARLWSGERLGTGRDVGHVARGVLVRLVPVEPGRSRERLAVAHEFFDAPDHEVEALQVVWRDAAGRWPWHDPAVAARQPLL